MSLILFCQVCIGFGYMFNLYIKIKFLNKIIKYTKIQSNILLYKDMSEVRHGYDRDFPFVSQFDFTNC